ncbi:MAG: carboxypeptidase-like regulatory domain-containing protein, partial [Calditrichia bacterium]|nr:carboxypeptidase-like regulatory domain-containing protein [Calditrichia bacterium]
MKYLILIFIILISSLNAQTIINGKIEDALTGKPLEAANIQITGSFRGTISNQDGEFSLGLTQIPSEVVISFIGYASNKTMINKMPDEPVIIKLQPIMLQMEPIVVVAEDPAVGIMKEVIKRKKIWREKLNTYKAHAYTRLSMETDSSIALITETISEAYWDKKRGPREIIKSKRQTENIANIKDLIVGASYITNFYDDDIEIQGFNVIGPTHPDALKHYNFKLLKEDRLDKKVVYKISVEPDSKLQPLMEGVVWVLDEDYALIKVNLKPSDNMVFPFPIQKYDLTYKQQFSNFGQEFWLPVDVRVKGTIKIGLVGLNFPEISYNQISQINDYNVN